MNVLFIGGTGVISSACARAAVARGFDLTLFCRGRTTSRPPARGATVVHGDIRDPGSVRAALGERRFDVVVQWMAFVPAHVELDIELFRRRTGQYIFISSASAYTPGAPVPITESTPLENPYSQYSRDKIACEARLSQAHRDGDFPVTVVRPSHTYDATSLPLRGGWTAVDRMRRGLPVIVADDGTSLWTLTHSEDFARGLVGLLGHKDALGESVHVTSDEAITWTRIHEIVARAADTRPRLVYVPSTVIAEVDAEWGASLLGDKTHSKVFDNTKIKRLVQGYKAAIPFSVGAAEQIAWYEEDARRRTVDEELNARMDNILLRTGLNSLRARASGSIGP
jgi:nucleoside-diphosphate-sugar epimerase